MKFNRTKSPSNTSGVSIYMAYLLRYIPNFPVTAAQLQKKAADKHFSRLEKYFGSLPPDKAFDKPEDVLNLFKNYNKNG